MRRVKPEEFISIKDKVAEVVDICRDGDYETSKEIAPGARWEDALSVAQACPFLKIGGSLEVSELIRMPVQ